MPTDTDVPWTASRCTRLLRPLVSKISTLERHASIFNTKSSQRSPSVDQESEDSRATEISNIYKSYAQDQARNHLQRRPKPRYRYGSRNASVRKLIQSRAADTRVSSDEPFSTPVLSKTRPVNSLKDSESRDWTFDNNHGKRSASSGDRFISTSVDWASATQNGVIDDFFKLLHVTAEPDTPESGARSLFQTCLRAIPTVITEERTWRLSQDADDKSDVDTEVYAMLEGHGSTSDGWQPLSQVVRANAVYLLESTIHKSLLQDWRIWAMIKRLEILGVSDVQARIERAFLRMATLERPNQYMYRGDMGTQSHLDNLHTFLVYESLPPFYTADSVYDLVLDAFDSITEAGSTSAIPVQELLEGIMSFPFINSSTARTIRTLRRSVGKICSEVMTILNLLQVSPSHGNKNYDQIVAQRILRGSVYAVMRACTGPISENADLTMQLAPVAAVILAADMFCMLTSNVDNHSEQAIRNRLKCIAHTVKTGNDHKSIIATSVRGISGLLDRVAQNLEKRAEDSGFSFLRTGCDYCTHYTSDDKSEESFMRMIALEASMNFARRGNNSAHVQYASTIERLVAKQNVSSSPVRLSVNNANAKWRWEAGLCEWVTATPKPSRPLVDESNSEEEYDLSELLDRENTSSPLTEQSSIGLEKENTTLECSSKMKETETGLTLGESCLIDQSPLRSMNKHAQLSAPPQSLTTACMEEKDELSLETPIRRRSRPFKRSESHDKEHALQLKRQKLAQDEAEDELCSPKSKRLGSRTNLRHH